MKLRNLKVETQPRLMIIPMIDIIFFLLVFFMISTLSMVEQKTVPVNLPQAASAKNDLSKSITLTVQANGTILFDQEDIPSALLEKRIRLEMQKNPDPHIILRGDKDAAYGQVISAFDALKQAGAQKISVAVEKR